MPLLVVMVWSFFTKEPMEKMIEKKKALLIAEPKEPTLQAMLA